MTKPLERYIISALMSCSLPKKINPWLLFRYHETVSGQLELSAMPNLRNSQSRQESIAQVVLSVVSREDGQVVLRGEANIELELECQRCLQPLIATFVAPFELVVVKYDYQLETVSEEDDAIVVEEQIEIAPLIEQELILALPMIAKHDDCQANYENSVALTTEHQQPFANLKDLLN